MIDYRNINDDQYAELLVRKEQYKKLREDLVAKTEKIIANGDMIIEELRQHGYIIDIEKNIFKPKPKFFFSKVKEEAYKAKNIALLNEFQNKIRQAQIELREMDVSINEVSMQYDAVCHMIEECERAGKLMAKDKMCEIILEDIDENIDSETE